MIDLKTGCPVCGMKIVKYGPETDDDDETASYECGCELWRDILGRVFFKTECPATREHKTLIDGLLDVIAELRKEINHAKPE